MTEDSRYRPPPEVKSLRSRDWDAVAADLPSLEDDAIFAVTAQTADAILDAAGAGPGVRMLDVACGPAQWAQTALARGVHLVGVDLSPGMIEEARRRNPGLDVRVGDAEALEFPDGSFDAIVCNIGIKGFPRTERFLAEAMRLLRPGGRLAFTTWYEDERNQLFGLVRDAIRRHLPGSEFEADRAQERDWSPAACEAMLAGAGFTGATARLLQVAARLRRPELVLDHVYTIGKLRRFLFAQPDESRAAIERDVIAQAAASADGERVELVIPIVLASCARPG
jgi:SAM-dependent methyltransferase